MTIEQLDKAHHAHPFKPFRLHLADGTSVPVSQPELLMRTPGGRTVFVCTGEDAAEIIDLLLVTKITFPNGSRHHRKAGLR